MTLEDLPEDFTNDQFMQLDREALDKIDYQVRKWQCQCKGCTNGTKVRDYGISPFFLMNTQCKGSLVHPEHYWWNLSRHYWLCGKHYKFFKRLLKSYSNRDIEIKLLDWEITPLQKLI